MVLFSRTFVRKRAISVVSPAQAGLVPSPDIARGAMRRGSMQVDMNAALAIHSRKPARQELSQWASFVSL